MTIEKNTDDRMDSQGNLSFLDLSFEQMVEDELYKNPKALFEWSKVITERVKCVGNHTALNVKKYLSDVEDSDAIFDGIINHGVTLGIVSNVQTSDKGYTAAVVISMYLNSQGLGYKKNSSTW